MQKLIRLGSICSLCLLSHSSLLAATTLTRSVLGGGAIGAVATSHRLRSTLAQTSVAEASSTHHLLRAGFWRMGAAVVAAPDPALPKEFRLASVAPNPFQRDLSIEFEVPAPGGVVSLRVFDIAGRQVRLLASGPAEAGRHRLLWDRTDDAGHRAGIGMYVLAFEAAGHRATRKLLALP